MVVWPRRVCAGRLASAVEPAVALVSLRIRRVELLRVRYGDRFETRWFTDDERVYCSARRRPGQHWAVRLAAKLAVRRLVGPGYRLARIEIARDDSGAPFVRWSGRTPPGRWMLSLSHEDDLAVALAAVAPVGEH